MYGGQTSLALAVSLIFIQVIVTCTDSPGFISIDCGVAEDYYDNNTGIFYKADTEFIDTVVNMIMTSESIRYGEFRRQVTTLRSFPQGIKNCYTLKPAQGKNNNYLIRGFFWYENYDGKNQAPVFDLYLGVNFWATIDSSLFDYSEIIHFSLTDNINICLVNIDSGIPFILSLELRLLNNSIYRIESGGLTAIWRDDIGGSKDILRSMDDIYDRIWIPIRLPHQEFPDWNLVSTQSTLSGNDAYYTPQEVMSTAAMTQNSSIPITFTHPLSTTLEYYVYLHFAEVESHPDGQLRELNISLNGEYLIKEAIKLEYLKPVTIGPLSSPVKDTGFSFSIYATEGCNLPPILSGFQVYQVLMLPVSPTDPEDVDAIMDIKQVYSITRISWQGDPCVPSNYSWDGLNSSDSNSPNIISLNLASSNLTGTIAFSFSNLTSIVSLDLSDNNLTGPVPEFLVQLPNLRTLNLSRNSLSGSIPHALMEKVKDGLLHLSVEGNPNLCTTDSCAAKKKNNFGTVLVVVLLTLSYMIICCGVWEKLAKSNNQRSKNKKEFEFYEIKKITSEFKTFIGKGAFGEVYSGTLKNHGEVAVKVLSPKSRQGKKEFRTEVKLLTRARHTNVVSLIGYCPDSEHMALVYEYMANGNLRKLLWEDNSANVLTWRRRLEIAIDAAQGLDYLHKHCHPPIFHRDMKTTNILLNENWQAKIADFGLSRDFRNEAGSLESGVPVGTEGYIDPEYEENQMFSTKSDVYSFGIVLLELITGQPAMIRDGASYIHIPHWVSVKIRNDIKNIVDKRLGESFDIHSAMKAVEIAWSCIQLPGTGRPEISDVVAQLKECLAILKENGSQRNLGERQNGELAARQRPSNSI